MRGHHHNTPKFIVGHSLGALYAMRICMKRPDFFHGCIAINPLLDFKEKPNSLTMAYLRSARALQVQERTIFPKMDTFLPLEMR